MFWILKKGNSWHKRIRAWKKCFSHVLGFAKGEQKAYKTTKYLPPSNTEAAKKFFPKF